MLLLYNLLKSRISLLILRSREVEPLHGLGEGSLKLLLKQHPHRQPSQAGKTPP